MKKLSLILLSVILLASCQEEESNPEIVSFSPSVGNYGDQVTITGSNFDEFNAVSFDGVEATIVSVSPNQLVVTVPVGSKSGSITISEGDKRIESASSFTVTSGAWKKVAKAPFIAEKSSTVAFTIAQSAYFSVRHYEESGDKNEFWQYNQVSNTWTERTPIAVDYAQSFDSKGFVIDGKGYMIEPSGGDLHEYNPETDKWTAKKALNFYGTEQSGILGAFSVGEFGYVLLSDRTLYRYTPATDTWTGVNVPSMPKDVYTTVSTSDKVYFLASGLKLYEFTTATTPASVVQKASSPASVSANPEILQGAGQQAFIGESYNVMEFWQYSAPDNRWIQKAPFIGEQVYSGVHFSIGNKLYLGFGASAVSDVLLHDVYEYTPE
ncbi:IPT/TIG domain-containing protein [Chryseolinea sp. T2]|uniref:IPT/TIG domain-containing protein n=1 Tax=Chryseolinea sp. T2 TaxID=3129255 RepID=UPI003077C631